MIPPRAIMVTTKRTKNILYEKINSLFNDVSVYGAGAGWHKSGYQLCQHN